MKIITKEEIVDFIMSQPDERPVNMKETSSKQQCGCVMVHYGKEVLEIDESFACGASYFNTGIESVARLDTIIDSIINSIYWRNIRTYGDIKNIINNENRRTD